MIYWHWLVAVSFFFVFAERLLPARREQPVVRAQLANDLAYLAFNGHFFALLAGGFGGALALRSRELLGSVLPFTAEGSTLATLPFAAQFVVYLLLSDFLQWCVHIALHRVPWLWQLHKVHHSIHEMDWAGNFRFHWMEIVVYRSVLYLPLALLGGDSAPLFAVALFATFWGHFNHANLKLGIGPFRFLLNSPRMHIWHHDASDEGGVAKNYGIVLSIWDWIFGTVYWPLDRAPARLGYPDDVEMPGDIVRQMLFPGTRLGR